MIRLRWIIQFFVSPTSGFLTSCGPLTPGYTGGYKHFALSELTYPISKEFFTQISTEKARGFIGLVKDESWFNNLGEVIH